MAGRGGAIPGSGRKPKRDEQKVINLLSPYIPKAIETVIEIMQNGKREGDRISAAKLLLSYAWGLPRQHTDITTNGQSINVPQLNVLSSEGATLIKQMYCERPTAE